MTPNIYQFIGGKRKQLNLAQASNDSYNGVHIIIQSNTWLSLNRVGGWILA